MGLLHCGIFATGLYTIDCKLRDVVPMSVHTLVQSTVPGLYRMYNQITRGGNKIQIATGQVAMEGDDVTIVDDVCNGHMRPVIPVAWFLQPHIVEGTLVTWAA